MQAVMFNFVGLGHIYPVCPILQQLKKRGTNIINCALEIHREPIEASDLTFIPYASYLKPPTSTLNLATNLTEWVIDLLPDIISTVSQWHPDFIMTDCMMPLGWYVAKILDVPLIVSTLICVMNETITNELGITGFMKQGDTGTYEVDLTRYQQAVDYLQTQYGIDPLEPREVIQIPGDMTLVTTSSTLQLKSELLDNTFKFVGPMIAMRSDAPDFPFDWIEQ